MRCTAYRPCYCVEHYSTHQCTDEEGHAGAHVDVRGNTWLITSEQPAEPSPIAEARAEAQSVMSKLTVFDALPVPPSKEEILAAIDSTDYHAVGSARMAVEELYRERGL